MEFIIYLDENYIKEEILKISEPNFLNFSIDEESFFKKLYKILNEKFGLEWFGVDIPEWNMFHIHKNKYNYWCRKIMLP